MSGRDTVVCITGCGSGIGRHLAECFYRRGYCVVCTDCMMERLHYATEWNHARVIVEALDVTRRQDWQRCMKLIDERWGRLDVLINNAGVLDTDYFHEIVDLDVVDMQIDVNLKGPIYGMHYALALLRKSPSPVVINISSLAGVAPIPGMSIYTASKYGLRGFTLAVATELERLGIRVYNVSPDAVRTPLIEGVRHKAASNLLFSGVLLSVEDVERVVFRLLRGPRRREVLLPWWRALLAHFANCFPYWSKGIARLLDAKGDKKRKQLSARNGDH